MLLKHLLFLNFAHELYSLSFNSGRVNYIASQKFRARNLLPNQAISSKLFRKTSKVLPTCNAIFAEKDIAGCS